CALPIYAGGARRLVGGKRQAVGVGQADDAEGGSGTLFAHGPTPYASPAGRSTGGAGFQRNNCAGGRLVRACSTAAAAAVKSPRDRRTPDPCPRPSKTRWRAAAPSPSLRIRTPARRR